MNYLSVPYLNALPLTHFLKGKIQTATPKEMMNKLASGDCIAALMPTYSIIQHGLYAYPNLGIIGCRGTVGSVGFFLKKPIARLQDIKSIYYDQESRSSVHLAKIILKKFYELNFEELEVLPFEMKDAADAQLLIGDKALFFENPNYKYLDIGDIWQKHTNSGFIFAAWASLKPLNIQEVTPLLEARRKGNQQINKILSNINPNLPKTKLKEYLTQNIVYQVSDNLLKGYQYYESYLKELKLIGPINKNIKMAS